MKKYCYQYSTFMMHDYAANVNGGAKNHICFFEYNMNAKLTTLVPYPVVFDRRI